MVAPRIRELRLEHARIRDQLSRSASLGSPPKHLSEDATILRFREGIRDSCISVDTPVAKNYLNFLVDRIVVHDDRVEEIKYRSAI